MHSMLQKFKKIGCLTLGMMYCPYLTMPILHNIQLSSGGQNNIATLRITTNLLLLPKCN